MQLQILEFISRLRLRFIWLVSDLHGCCCGCCCRGTGQHPSWTWGCVSRLRTGSGVSGTVIRIVRVSRVVPYRRQFGSWGGTGVLNKAKKFAFVLVAADCRNFWVFSKWCPLAVSRVHSTLLYVMYITLEDVNATWGRSRLCYSEISQICNEMKNKNCDDKYLVFTVSKYRTEWRIERSQRSAAPSKISHSSRHFHEFSPTAFRPANHRWISQPAGSTLSYKTKGKSK